MHDFVLPALILTVKRDMPAQFEDWLRWGSDLPPNFILKSGVNVTIGDNVG